MSVHTTDIDLLDHTDDPDNDIVLPTDGVNTPPDIASSTEHVISTQPVSTDHDDTTMSTTSSILIDVTQTDSTDTGETTELVAETTAMDEVKTTALPISTDHEDIMSTTDAMLTQTDSTDTADTTEDDLLQTTGQIDEVQTTAVVGSDVAQPEISTTENVDDFIADGEALGAGSGDSEVMATDSAVIVRPFIGLTVVLAFAMLTFM